MKVYCYKRDASRFFVRSEDTNKAGEHMWQPVEPLWMWPLPLVSSWGPYGLAFYSDGKPFQQVGRWTAKPIKEKT